MRSGGLRGQMRISDQLERVGDRRTEGKNHAPVVQAISELCCSDRWRHGDDIPVGGYG